MCDYLPETTWTCFNLSIQILFSSPLHFLVFLSSVPACILSLSMPHLPSYIQQPWVGLPSLFELNEGVIAVLWPSLYFSNVHSLPACEHYRQQMTPYFKNTSAIFFPFVAQLRCGVSQTCWDCLANKQHSCVWASGWMCKFDGFFCWFFFFCCWFIRARALIRHELMKKSRIWLN